MRSSRRSRPAATGRRSSGPCATSATTPSATSRRKRTATCAASCPALEWNGAARAELIKIVAGFRESYERHGASPALAEDLSCELSGWVARYIPGPVTALPCVTPPR